MIASKELQNAYVHLYENLREYVWPFNIVDSIADLEIETYKSFPDISSIRNLISRLKLSCLRLVDDELLEDSFSDFEEILNTNEELYAKLNTRTQEDIIDEDF